jgi:hypothetical protein
MLAGAGARAVLCSCLMIAGFSLSAAAEMRVIESDVADIKVGSVWADGATLPVPPGKSVRVLVLPGNVSKTIEGPRTETGATAPWGATRQPIAGEAKQ